MPVNTRQSTRLTTAESPQRITTMMWHQAALPSRARRSPKRATAQSFPLFKLLPVELRLMIWEEALRQDLDQRVITYNGHLGFILNSSLCSAMLATTRESRSCAKKWFNLKLDVLSYGTEINTGVVYLRIEKELINITLSLAWPQRIHPKPQYTRQRPQRFAPRFATSCLT
ncbi:hypothetical protein JX266_010829 [Neoarthrinium moseri]|uniref:uncharacterized protein n=1 Tax=Neoarthrinium moseri TaxID=1658444 RepID=UPI001FDB7B28|nr:uncharacterized protein JN550_005263 [Neoarthrinium moseri]KAI1842976.1 hypothetical protein JX266_010829 [Neoarthrinium moseri]KAI1870335.1 hypothetical protein JN550_005263 [Neoarthrinium moseri]